MARGFRRAAENRTPAACAPRATPSRLEGGVRAAQTPITERLQPKKDRAALLVSHFHQVLDLGITRGAFAAGARSYYGRDAHDTRIPDLSTYEGIANAAASINQGEADRLTAEGAAFVAMSNPGAAEVETARVAFNLSKQADVNLDRESEEAGDSPPEALALAVDLNDQMEFFYRKDPDASSRLQKCERWGVVYVFDPNEPQAPATGTGTGGGTTPPTGGGGTPANP